MTPLVDALRAQARAIEAVATALEQSAIACDVLDVAQAAELARCSPRTLRKAIKGGKLTARGKGRHVIIGRADLDAWLAALPPRPVRRDVTEHDGVAVEVTEEDVDRKLDELAERRCA